MKYPCEMIKDLLPLYTDNVCSDQSKKIVEEHLHECADCYKYCEELIKAGTLAEVSAHETDEAQMAESLKKVKKSINRKSIFAAAVSALIVLGVICMSAIAINGLQQTKDVIVYKNNIAITGETPDEYSYINDNGYLFARLQGGNISGMSHKLVNRNISGEIQQILYFKLYTTRWDNIISSYDDISYITLTQITAENDIDKIFYYEGDLHNLEIFTEEDFDVDVDKNSVLLWEKAN